MTDKVYRCTRIVSVVRGKRVDKPCNKRIPKRRAMYQLLQGKRPKFCSDECARANKQRELRARQRAA